MRPRPPLLWLALAVAAISFLIVLLVPGLAGLLAPLWALLAVLGLVDLALSVPPRAIRLEVGAPAVGFAGQTAPLELRATSAGRLPPHLRLELEVDPALEASELPPMPAEGRMQGGLRLTRRGTHTLHAVHAIWPSRLGLWDMLARQEVGDVLTVVPDISPIASGQITAQMLPLTQGHKDMRLKGDGSEFHQLRDFRPGMDPRMIDWKRSARMRGLVARETRAERNHQIVLGIDSGHLMAESIRGIPKLDRAINAALAMAWAGGLGGDQVGLFSFDSRPRLWLPPAPGRAAFARMQGATAAISYEAAETNHTLGLSTLMGRLKRRSLVILFTDFTDTTTAELLVENTGILARHHLVLHVALRDPVLQALAHPDAVDLDTIARAVSAAQVLRERAAVLDRLQRLGVLCLDVTPEGLTPALVARYLDIKSRELI